MYIRTNEGIRQELTPTNRLSSFYLGEPMLSGGGTSIDVKLAVAHNKLLGKKLKWDSQVSNIKSFLISALGLSSIATPEDLARAVAMWQHRHGGDKKPDGEIGPITWAKLQKAMKAANPPPVSPSQVSPTPNAAKHPKWLAQGIYEAESITLVAWISALGQFGEVMKAVSDKEGTADFAGVLQSFIQGTLLDTIVKKLPLAEEIAKKLPLVQMPKQLLDALEAENKRASQAREAGQLRDFLVRFQRRLTDAQVDLSHPKEDYFYQVEKYYEMASEVDKKAYKQKLVEYLDRLDKMREDGWLNGALLFEKFAFDWIRNTKATWPKTGGIGESFVQTWVDDNGNVMKAFILAPGGQKIAEQFLKDANGTGLRPYKWPVRRRTLFHNKDNIAIATSALNADGKLDTRDGPRHRTQYNEPLAELKFKGLLAGKPTTKDVEGL